MTATISCVISFPVCRPRIEPARDCEGYYIVRGSHGWLVGDRRAALREFDDLIRFERGGRG